MSGNPRMINRTWTSRNAVAAYSVFAILLTNVTLWIIGDPVPIEQKILASILIVVAIIPGIVFYLESNPPLVPLMALNCLAYVIMFGMNGFYFIIADNATMNNLSSYSWLSGLTLGIIGLFAQLFGYYFTRLMLGRPRPLRIVAGLEPSRTVFLAWGMISIRTLHVLIPEVGEIPTFGQFAKFTPYVGFGLLIMLSLQGHLAKWHSCIVYGVGIPVEMVVRLNTGAIYEPVLMVIFVFLIRWVVARKFNIILLVVGLTVYAAFNPVKHDFRDIVLRTTSGREKSTVEKISLLFELAGNYWLFDESKKDNIRLNLMGRLNHLALAAMVTELTPESVPYWNGETLEAGTTSFIPRILWPDKPNLSFGNYFGIRYGVLDQTNTTTTLNLNWVIELYANFGYIAVLFGMTFFGFAFAMLERWIASPGTDMIDCILPLSCVFPLIYPESNIVMMWGGVLSSMFAFYVIALFLKGK